MIEYITEISKIFCKLRFCSFLPSGVNVFTNQIVKIGDPADSNANIKACFIIASSRNSSAVISDPTNNPQKTLLPNKQAIVILNPAGIKMIAI